MATLTWTPADGFTRKRSPVVTKPTVEKLLPKPPAQPSKAKRPKPSEIRRLRAYWLRQNQLSPQDLTIADQYLVKQAKTATPMVFLGYGMTYSCTVTKLWRYDIDLTIEGHKRRIHKLDMALYYKAQDA